MGLRLRNLTLLNSNFGRNLHIRRMNMSDNTELNPWRNKLVRKILTLVKYSTTSEVLIKQHKNIERGKINYFTIIHHKTAFFPASWCFDIKFCAFPILFCVCDLEFRCSNQQFIWRKPALAINENYDRKIPEHLIYNCL